MKIIQILPGFEEGGVERHVLWLSNELAARGHHILVVSSGGKLEKQLAPAVKHWKLPVHLKNPVTASWCAAKIAARAKKEGWELLHAHSRVPDWIAWWGSTMAKRPWVVTAHGMYSKNAGLIPLKHADGAICVSQMVREHLRGFLPESVFVVRNGIPEPKKKWKGPEGKKYRFLFIGRLTRVKGIDFLIDVFTRIEADEWTLDILGDGPLRGELENKVKGHGLQGKIRFHGFVDDTEHWLASCSALLFPSRSEGNPLTLAQAIMMGVPCMMSDIPEVRELALGKGKLLDSGDTGTWVKAIDSFLKTPEQMRTVAENKVTTCKDMALEIQRVYQKVVRK